MRTVKLYPRSRDLLLVALALSLAGCPGDDGTAESGSMTSATTAGGTATAGTSDDTAGAGTTGGPVAVCSFDDEPWTFTDALGMPELRGVAESEAPVCNPVTADTVTLDVELVVPEGIVLDPAGTVRVLLFEYDPNVADSIADCVGGLCESLDGSSLRWSFEVPNDLPELGYYIAVDVDTDGPDVDACTLHETDFVTFAPAQGSLVVPMTADGCV